MQLCLFTINPASGIIFQIIFASLMVLALAGLTHLSVVIIYNINGNANTYLLALASALGNGVIVALTMNATFILFKNTHRTVVKYLFLNTTILLLHYCLNVFLFYWLAKSLVGTPEISRNPGWTALLFASHPMIVGSFLFYYITREQSRTKKITEQEYQLLQLKELKTKAELEALQAKINPHFLYNSLNSIASLVHINPDKAEEMVVLLAKFFRYSTSVKSEYFHTLGEELEMVSTYLEVEKVRFDERLTYTIHYAEEDLGQYLIPRFLLQPLVENAIKHGIAKVAGNGIISLQIAREGQLLKIIVHDNGPHFPDHFTSSYGLQSTSDKLRMLCGEEARLEIRNFPFKHIKITTILLLEPQVLDAKPVSRAMPAQQA